MENKKDEDVCDKCGAHLDNKDYKMTTESRGEFWGAPCSETIVTGYVCPNCGFECDF